MRKFAIVTLLVAGLSLSAMAMAQDATPKAAAAPAPMAKTTAPVTAAKHHKHHRHHKNAMKAQAKAAPTKS